MTRLLRFLVGGVLALPAAAQTPLTVTDAARAALELHPALRAAAATLGAAEAGLGRARAGWWPALALDAGASRFGEPMVVAPLHGFDLTRPPLFDRTLWQASLNLSWQVLDPQRGGRVGRARADAAAADAGDRATAQAVLVEVARTYFEVAAARDAVAAHEARVGALERERDRARLLVREGRAARVAALRAEAALAGARAEQLGAVGRRDAAERSLERLLDVAPGTLATRALAPAWFAPGDAVPPRADALEAALAANPDLRRLEGQRAGAAAGRAQARGAWLPDLRLVGRLIQYGSGAGAEATEWQAGVALSYPLFTGGARRAASAEAGARLTAADAVVADARRRLGDTVDGVLATLTAATGRVAALDVAVTQAEEVVRIERLALDEGAGIQNDYLTAEAELLRVRAARSDARAAALGARIELARLMGELSPAWLDGHLESGS